MVKYTKQQLIKQREELRNLAEEARKKKLINKPLYNKIIDGPAFKYGSSKHATIEKYKKDLKDILELNVQTTKKSLRAKRLGINKAFNKLYIVSYDIEYVDKYPKKTHEYPGTESGQFKLTVSKENLNVRIEETMKIIEQNLTGQAYPAIRDIKSRIWKVISKDELKQKNINIDDIAMYRALPLKYMFLENKADLNSGNGECVYDVLQKYYNISREEALRIFNEGNKGKLLDGFVDEQTLTFEDGVSTKQLTYLAQKKRFSLYALDIQEKVFCKYLDPLRKKPALIYYMANSHMYPVLDVETRNHIIKVNRETKAISTFFTSENTKDENRFTLPIFENIEVEELTKYRNCNIIYNNNSLNKIFIKLYVLHRTIYKHIVKRSKIVKIEFDNNVWLLVNPHWKTVQLNCAKFDIPFTNQSLPELAQQIFDKIPMLECSQNQLELCSMISKRLGEDKEDKAITDELSNANLNKSTMNKITEPIISQNKMKAFRDTFKRPSKKIVKAFDIRRCFMNALRNNTVDIPLFTCFDIPKPFTELTKSGWYFVRTKNYFPFRGNDWYPYQLVKYGIEQGIQLEIDYELIPSKYLPAKYFNCFIDFVYNRASDEDAKNIVNMFIGCLGSSDYTSQRTIYTEDLNEASYFFFKNDNSYVSHVIDDLFKVTIKNDKIMSETNVPVYNHIIANATIDLHKLWKKIEAVGGSLVMLKTDCVIAEFDREVDFELGKLYKYDEVPKEFNIKFGEPSNQKYEFIEWKWNDIAEKDDFEELADDIRKLKKSIFINGEAGTGKTYLAKLLKKNSICLAPTNKAALLLNGITIHKFIGKYNGLKSSKIFNILKQYEYIVVDEVSMMNSFFYHLFRVIKQNSTVKFIFVGDFRQLPPVGEEHMDFLNSFILHELCDGNRLVLTKNRRSDSIMWDIVHSMDSTDIRKQFGSNECFVNLCWRNKTRKAINKKCMERWNKLNPSYEPLFVRKGDDFIQSSQDMWLNIGMPVISKMTNNKHGIYNNESFVVKEILDDRIILENEMNPWLDVSVDEFRTFFNVAFAVTVHKSQGSTFDKPYMIHEWDLFTDKMKYVALTRTSKKELVNFSTVSYVMEERQKEEIYHSFTRHYEMIQQLSEQKSNDS